MYIIISIIQGFLSLLIAAAAFYYARKKDNADLIAQSTSLMEQLKTISRDVEEMKNNVKEMRREWHDDHDKIVSMERDIKAIWKHIDKINEKEGK